MIIKTIKLKFLMVLSLVLAVMPAIAAQDAPILPKAKTSTMLDVARVGQRMVAVGDRGHVLYSDDHGSSWEQAKVPFRRMLTAVTFVNDRVGMAVGHESTILTTSDGGSTWSVALDGMEFKARDNRDAIGRAEDGLVDAEDALAAIEAAIEASGSNPDLEFELEEAEYALEDAEFALEDAEFAAEEAPLPVPFLDVWFMDEQHGWAVGAFGLIVETVDGGKNWSSIAHRLGNTEGFHLNSIAGSKNGELFLAAEAGLVFRSLDAGQTWEQVQTQTTGSLFGITFNEVSKQVLVFGISSTLLGSSDLGATWTSLLPPNVKQKVSLSGGYTSRAGETVIVGMGGFTLMVGSNGRLKGAFLQKGRRGSLSSVAENWNGDFVVAGQGGAALANFEPIRPRR